jgi:thioredoxin-related protein
MVDLSTEWCSWCKVMEKKIFTDLEVLALMQPKINSYVLDAEKDSIGQLLKLKYGVAAYCKIRLN